MYLDEYGWCISTGPPDYNTALLPNDLIFKPPNTFFNLQYNGTSQFYIVLLSKKRYRIEKAGYPYHMVDFSIHTPVSVALLRMFKTHDFEDHGLRKLLNVSK